MADDDDGMAFLQEKRAQLEAMQGMALVAQQANLVMENVARRLHTIESLEHSNPNRGKDQEVEYWEQKIAELSGEAPTARPFRNSAPRAQLPDPGPYTFSTDLSQQRAHQDFLDRQPRQLAQQGPTKGPSTSMCTTCFLRSPCPCQARNGGMLPATPSLCTTCFDVPCVCRR
eukprot:CAMPEP_0114543668 /NCGR_PEP_ID=MMETSP0114-20121206/2478_1 /TAXON_ID=31324 /ORGANISM="Goniomonas sp, Strain m" /LENGTH=171 /DNA_ID=CAMNT_0001728021 /DNA_START=15 /DNA_END=530 /DNA_ORIENTATION=+